MWRVFFVIVPLHQSTAPLLSLYTGTSESTGKFKSRKRIHSSMTDFTVSFVALISASQELSAVSDWRCAPQEMGPLLNMIVDPEIDL